MTETIQITLGGKEYAVRKLTLRQNRALGIGVVRQAPQQPEDVFAHVIDRAIDVLVVALKRDYPDITADSLLDLEVSTREMSEASAKVLSFSGFLKDAPPGEAKPGAA